MKMSRKEAKEELKKFFRFLAVILVSEIFEIILNNLMILIQ